LESAINVFTTCLARTDDDDMVLIEDKLGIKSFADLFMSDEGRAFAEAVALLNGANDVARDSTNVAAAIRTYHSFLATATEEKAKACKRLAKTSSRLFLFSMELLEAMSLVHDPTTWASHFKGKEDAPASAQQPVSCCFCRHTVVCMSQPLFLYFSTLCNRTGTPRP
jgi:hypothetical protein